jgi:hypothetical protein
MEHNILEYVYNSFFQGQAAGRRKLNVNTP